MNQRWTLRQVCFAPLIGIALIILSISIARAQDENLDVEVKVNVIQGNFALARKRAIEIALPRAIAMSAQKLLPSNVYLLTSEAIEERVGKATGGLVVDYQILREIPSQGELIVSLRVQTNPDRVRELLNKWGVLQERSQKPKLGLFQISQGSNALAGDISSFFSEGFQILDYPVRRMEGTQPRPEDTELSEYGDFFIWGRVTKEDSKSFRADLKIAAPTQISQPVPLRLLIRSDKGEDFFRAMVLTHILERVMPLWLSSSGAGNRYLVEVRGLRNAKFYQSLRDVLNSGKNGFTSGQEVTYQVGAVVFETLFDGNLEKMIRGLNSAPEIQDKFVLKKDSESKIILTVQ